MKVICIKSSTGTAAPKVIEGEEYTVVDIFSFEYMQGLMLQCGWAPFHEKFAGTYWYELEEMGPEHAYHESLFSSPIAPVKEEIKKKVKRPEVAYID